MLEIDIRGKARPRPLSRNVITFSAKSKKQLHFISVTLIFTLKIHHTLSIFKCHHIVGNRNSIYYTETLKQILSTNIGTGLGKVFELLVLEFYSVNDKIVGGIAFS